MLDNNPLSLIPKQLPCHPGGEYKLATRLLAWIFTCFLIVMLPGVGNTLTILSSDEPPGNFFSPTGEVTGISIEIVQELQKRMQDTTPIIVMPEQRILKEANKDRSVLFFSFSRTPDREHEFKWLMPVFRKSWVFYVLKEAAQGKYTLEDLQRLKIGSKLGDVRNTYLITHGFENVDSIQSHAANIQKMKAGRIDAVLYDPAGMAFDCKLLGRSYADFTPVLTVGYSDVYLAFSQSTPESEFAAWKQAADSIIQDGTYKAILERWSRKLRETVGIQSEVTDSILVFK